MRSNHWPRISLSTTSLRCDIVFFFLPDQNCYARGALLQSISPKLARTCLRFQTPFSLKRLWHSTQTQTQITSRLRLHSTCTQSKSNTLWLSPPESSLAVDKRNNFVMTETSEITRDGKTFNVVKEGLAEILTPKPPPKDGSHAHERPKVQDVFYNPVQQFNRDLTVLAIRAFGGDLALTRGTRGHKRKRGSEDNAEPTSSSTSRFPFRILDALSATGLRAIRYAKEVPETTKVVANDLSEQATASIRLNVLHNEVPDKVNVLTGDARAHMYHVAAPTPGLKNGENPLYEVIDLDPYGTAAPFLDAAVRAVVDGGLLCVTCTDATVFASAGYPEKSFSQYGGLSWKGPQSHEGGLRLVLHAIAVCAARYGISIEPLLSLSIDFYVRIFVRVHRSPAQVKFLAGKSMIVYNCDMGCGAWNTQFLAQTRELTAKNGSTFHKFSFAQAPSTGPFCEHCGFKTHLSGPMWGGPLHNPFFIQRILDALPSLDSETYRTIPRIEGMLTVAYQESVFAIQPKNSPESDIITRPVPPVDPTLRDHHPFFFNLSTLAGVLHCVGPSDAVFCSALKRLGYRISRSHTKAGSIRTDAPWSVVWEVMREWMRQKAPVKEDAIRKGTAAWGIMQKDRSNATLNSVKTSLKQVLEKSEDLQTIRTELEAVLYRLGEAEEEEAVAVSANPLNSENQQSSPPTILADLSPPPPPPPPRASSLTNPSIPEPPPISTPTPTPTPTHQLDVVFDMDRRVRSPSPARKIVRYQMNPRPQWGPISRAKGG